MGLRNILALAVWLAAASASAQETKASALQEEPIAPYEQADANAGAPPLTDPEVLKAFNGREGVDRIVDSMLDLSLADPQIGPIFEPFDQVRLRRTLKEQFCYLLGGGCAYTGRTMQAAHADMGLQTRDLAILITHLRTAMEREGVPFRMQNRLLAVLAPMRRDIVQR